jgi:hypothetical protein
MKGGRFVDGGLRIEAGKGKRIRRLENQKVRRKNYEGRLGTGRLWS